MKKLVIFLTIPIWLPLALAVSAVGVAIALGMILAFIALFLLAAFLPITAIVGMFLACAFIFSDFFSFLFFVAFAMLLITTGRLIWWLVVLLTRTFWSLIGRKNELKPPKQRKWKKIISTCVVAALILAIAIANNAKTALYIDKTGLHLEQSLQTYSRQDFPDGFESVYVNTIGQNVEIVEDSTYYVETWSRKSQPEISVTDGLLSVTSFMHTNDISFDIGWGNFLEHNLIRVHSPRVRDIEIITDYGAASMRALEMPDTIYKLTSRGQVKFDDNQVSSPFIRGNNDAVHSISIKSTTGNISLSLYGKLMGDENIFLPEELR